MEKITDIEYKVLNYDSTIGNTRLELKFKGKDINYIVMNTLRRVILSDIPIYAFTDFNFKKNTSIFNNNYIKLRIKNIPVWGIDNKKEIFIPDIINNDNNNEFIIEEEQPDDIELESNIENINSSSLNELTMYVDYTSTSKEIISVTTDNAKFYYGEKKIDSPYKIPIQLVKLQPDQSIIFSTITSLGTHKQNAIYACVSVCFYKEVKENEFDFILESRGQLTEKIIIERAIINIIDKLKKIIKNIDSKIDNNKLEGQIILINEEHTLGNLLKTGMLLHKNVKIAGYNVPHPLEEKVIINYELESKGDIIEILTDVTEYYIKLFQKINKLVNS
jgi:DNA-directed RNA polymerase subunit L